jgi:hypothetical protein
MTSAWRRLPAAALITIFAAACSPGAETADAATQQPAQGLPEGHPPIAGGPGTVATANGPGGVVLETMDAAGYTYVRLGAADRQIWVAGPVTAVVVGDTLQLVNPMSMGSFTSKALDRTFEDLFFVDAFVKPGQAPPSAAHPGGTVGMRGVIQETMDAGGYTYVRVTINDKDAWLAGPQTVVSAGQTVTWSGGMVMRNFKSNTLNKTFDQIYFVNALTVVEGG